MTLQTIIKQRCGTASDWESDAGKAYKPEPGEVCWYSIPVRPKVNEETGEIIESYPDEVVFKVGDGVHTFEQLPFGQAKAADVYGWAKQDTQPFLNWLGTQETIQQMIDSRIESYLSDANWIIDANDDPVTE